MAVDYRTALLDQLDPTQQRKNADGTPIESPATAPKWTGGETATPPMDPNQIALARQQNPALYQAAVRDAGMPYLTPPPASSALTPVPGVTGPLSSDPNSPNVKAAVDYAATQQPKPPSTASVTLAGWDPSRTDNNGKYEYGRAVQAALNSGQTYNADWVRSFVAQHPNEWEIDPNSSPNDPHIRQKQSYLNSATGDSKQGQTSIYQDVLGDAGGANRPQFSNVEGDPALGYAAPTASASPSMASPMSAGSGTSGLASALQGDPYAAINSGLSAISGPSQTDTLLQTLLAQLRGGK
jgi:hypothetical protein